MLHLWPLCCSFICHETLCNLSVSAIFLCCNAGGFPLADNWQKKLHTETSSGTNADDDEKDAAPFENAKEEKTETSPNSISEEYLREDTDHFASTDTPLKHNKCHTADAFVAYYGESASQPPETSHF